MKYIQIAMEKLTRENDDGAVENTSILKKILNQAKDPKIATVLALDLMLVGVDTVSNFPSLFMVLDFISSLLRSLIRHLSQPHR